MTADTDEAAFLRDLTPTIEEVDAELGRRNYGDALEMSLSRLVTLVIGTFRQEGFEFQLESGGGLGDHGLKAIVSALAKALNSAMSGPDQPKDKLIAAAGLLNAINDLLQVMAGEYDKNGAANHMAAVSLASVSVGNWSMMLGHERLGIATKAQQFEQSRVRTKESIEAANQARQHIATDWRAKLDRYCTATRLTAENNHAIAEGFRAEAESNGGRSVPKSNIVETEVALIRKKRAASVH